MHSSIIHPRLALSSSYGQIISNPLKAFVKVVKTPTQPQLNIIHPPIQTQCRPYLSSHWFDFDQTLKVGFQIPNVTVTFVRAIFVLTTFFHIMNSSVVPDLILTQFFGGLNFFRPKFFFTQIFLDPKGFGNQLFRSKIFRTQKSFYQTFLNTKFNSDLFQDNFKDDFTSSKLSST